MKITKMFVAVLITLVMVLPFAGCGSDNYEPLDLVPESAEMIGSMKMSEALRDYQIYTAIDGNEEVGEWVDSAKVDFFNNTGIDITDISEALVFGTQTSGEYSDTPDYAGVVLTGNFADRDLIDTISKNTETEYDSEKYGEFTLYTAQDGESALVKISNSTLLLGTVDAVTDSLDVAAGNKKAITGKLLDTYNDLGDVMLKMAMTIPDMTKDMLVEEQQSSMIPVGLDAFADMEMLGLSAAMTTQALTFSMNIDFLKDGSAGKAAESLETIFGFIGMMSSDQDITDFIDRIDVTASSSTMNITYDITLGELADMIQSVQDSEDFSDSGLFEGFDIPGPGGFELPEGLGDYE